MINDAYDAIIVGASFAGLAAASQLRGNILLLDKDEIGAGQTSACGTTLNVLELLGCEDSLEQIWDTGFIHTPKGVVRYDFPYPLCSFNYKKFCQKLARIFGADFVKAKVLEVRAGSVVTDAGSFRGKYLIDASGWRAVLAGMPGNSRLNSKMSFGIETTVPHRTEGIHFYFDPRLIKRGFGWLFPCGEQARIGVASYVHEHNLRDKLDTLLAMLGFAGGDIHGGFFPAHLNKPTSGNVFLVGDAAGQCEPLSGFGIRPALYFGFRCGAIVQQIIEGRLTLAKGLKKYERIQNSFRPYYGLLEWLQDAPMALPGSIIIQAMLLLSLKPLCHDALNWHWQHSCLEELLAKPLPDTSKSTESSRYGRAFRDIKVG